MVDTQKFLRRIKDLEIQGATNVAVKTLEHLETEFSQEEPVLEAAVQRIRELRDQVLNLRPTEPMLTNLANIAVKRVQNGEGVVNVLQELVERVEHVNESISQHAEPLFREVETVLTHCHSSTATRVLIDAHKKHGFDVYATETRPKYQGRITAEELVEAGVDTTQIVDSAVYSILDEVDAVVVGADALTDSHVYNKIGTSQIAFLAYEKNIPFYVASTLLKYTEQNIEIEQRGMDEVWKQRPKELCILNPAFDAAPWAHVTGVLTENGVLAPEELPSAAEQLS